MQRSTLRCNRDFDKAIQSQWGVIRLYSAGSTFLLGFCLFRDPHSFLAPPRRAILLSRPARAAYPSNFGPTPSSDRIESLDALRGFALLMILIANMPGFYSPLYYLSGAAAQLPSSRTDRIVETLIYTLVQNESVALFSFLFGLGFALQFLRAQSNGISFALQYVRRLLALILIGLIHAYLIWMGDIVALYGVLGFVLLLFRNVNLKAILFLALVLYFWPQVRWEASLLRNSSGAALVTDTSTPDSAQEKVQEEARRQFKNSMHAYGHGTWLEITAQRARDYSFYIKHNQTMTVLPLFLLGLYAGRRGLFSNISRHLPRFRFVATWSFAAAFSSVVLLRILYLEGLPDSARLLRPVFYAMQHTALLIFYVSSVVVLQQSPRFRRWMTPLAAAGRLALSNYLLQSVICTLIFYSYGLALYGRVGVRTGLLIAFAVFALQVFLSVLWLRRFLLGPVEWLWRSVTYGSLQAIRP